jgi:hypothetical protein
MGRGRHGWLGSGDSCSCVAHRCGTCLSAAATPAISISFSHLPGRGLGVGVCVSSKRPSAQRELLPGAPKAAGTLPERLEAVCVRACLSHLCSGLLGCVPVHPANEHGSRCGHGVVLGLLALMFTASRLKRVNDLKIASGRRTDTSSQVMLSPSPSEVQHRQ